MRVDQWLQEATTRLEQAGIGTARLDVLVLLEDVLAKNRAIILAHPEQLLSEKQLVVLEQNVQRRCTHEPLAYIRGRIDFYGRQFRVTRDVLVPRPESETLIDQLKRLPLTPHIAIVDVGTGSGALGITAGLEVPNAEVVLTDINPTALNIAYQNSRLHNLQVKLLQGDLLTPFFDRSPEAFVVVANLPYVPDRYHVNEAAQMEPRLAIYGGEDGLDLYRRLWEQTKVLSHPPLYVITETLPFQHEDMVQIATQTGYQLVITDDFIQVFTMKSEPLQA